MGRGDASPPDPPLGLVSGSRCSVVSKMARAPGLLGGSDSTHRLQLLCLCPARCPDRRSPLSAFTPLNAGSIHTVCPTPLSRHGRPAGWHLQRGKSPTYLLFRPLSPRLC